MLVRLCVTPDGPLTIPGLKPHALKGLTMYSVIHVLKLGHLFSPNETFLLKKQLLQHLKLFSMLFRVTVRISCMYFACLSDTLQSSKRKGAAIT